MQVGDVTDQLRRWRSGDAEALQTLTPLVYEHLRKVAMALLQGESNDHTWQATELVNELFIQLLNLNRLELNDRAHFFALSARLMRRILVGHARTVKAVKRGHELRHVPLEAELAWVEPDDSPEVLDLDAALDALTAHDEELTRTVELRYIFGFTATETAQLLGSSKASVDRDTRYALTWLYRRLHPAV